MRLTLCLFVSMSLLTTSSCHTFILNKNGEFTNEEEPMSTSPSPTRPTHPMDNPNWLPPVGPVEELEIDYWINSGQDLLRQQLEKNRLNLNWAKNIVIVIGDGLSLATQMATRAYMGNENVQLSFEKLPYTGLAKTYCVNYQVPDSACTATAILAGIKNNYETIAVSAKVPLRNCTAHTKSEEVDSIFKFAQDAGKRSGIVTTSRVTHATPACAFAHSAARTWETTNEIPEGGCVDIASQLVHGEVGRRLNVVMGGGRREFLPVTVPGGSREDNRDLINEWKERKDNGERKWAYMENRDDLLSLDVSQLDYLMGLFQLSHMSYTLTASENEPSLTEMTIKALDMLMDEKGHDDDDGEGFILLVEAARIDHGHHDTWAQMALEETVQMHRAVEAVMERVSLKDTLVLVTADHSHTMTVGGYPPRGTDILGKGDFSREDEMAFFTMSYANGMGYFQHTEDEMPGRRDPRGMDYHYKWFEHPATVPLDSETHGGEDVAVFAAGPHAHLFTGLYEQHYLAHGMMYAACLGRPGRRGGDGGEQGVLKHENCPSGGSKLFLNWSLLVWAVLFICS